MRQRSVEVVRAVRDGEGVRPAELARHFGVSVRSIRTWVSQANEELAGVAKIALEGRGGGYVLDVTDADALERALQGSSQSRGRLEEGPSTPEERVRFIVNDLLMRTDWARLQDYADSLFVSKTSIASDMRAVEEFMGRYGLALERRPHYGVRVVGNEMDRRLCLVADVLERLSDGERLGSDETARLLKGIGESVQEAVREHGFNLNPVIYQNLLIHIAVAGARIQEGCYVPVEDERLASMRGSEEWIVAQDIAKGIERLAGIRFPEEEICYMAIHLAGKRMFTEEDEGAGNLIVSDEVWAVVARMLHVVRRTYHYDFTDDLELRMNLARHVVPLAVRLKWRMGLKNPMLIDIKERFPLAFAMALDSSAVLAEEYGHSPSEDEAGYIALAFALALERLRAGQARKSVLLVCATGRGSARLLETMLRQKFGEHLDRVVTCDVLHLGEQDLTGIDYVFTTVPISDRLSVPVCEVKHFFSDDDVRALRGVFSAGVPSSQAESRLDEDLFFPHLTCATKDEVIRLLCGHLAGRREVGEELESLVFERERLMPTAFGNGVAMPHPLRPTSDEMYVCVGLLDKAVSWGTEEVRAVFLVSIPRGNEVLSGFFDTLSSLLLDRRAMAKLLAHQDFETLSSLVRSFDRERS